MGKQIFEAPQLIIITIIIIDFRRRFSKKFFMINSSINAAFLPLPSHHAQLQDDIERNYEISLINTFSSSSCSLSLYLSIVMLIFNHILAKISGNKI